MDLKEAKKILPYGSIKKIADKIKVSTATIHGVLNGRVENSQVIIEVMNEVKFYLSQQIKINKVKKELDSLMKEINE